MPGPEIGEAARIIIYTGGGALGLKIVEVAIRFFGLSKNFQATDLAKTIEASANLREELRKDNQALREQVQELEERVDQLELEVDREKASVERLKQENEDLKARIRLHEAAFRLKPDGT